MINPNKPLRFVNEDRPVTLIGKMPNGDIVVTSTYGNGEPWESPLVFDHANGKCVQSGTTLTLINIPEVKSGFYPLDRNGATTGVRGLVALMMAKRDYPGITHFVEIITTDGVPTEAKIHAR